MSTEAAVEMTCQQFVELVTDLIEGQLAEARRVEARAHMGECDGCATYLEQIRKTIAGLRALADSDDFPRTREQAIAAFRELERKNDPDRPGRGTKQGRRQWRRP